LALPNNVTPKILRWDRFIISRCPNKIRGLASVIFCLMPMIARDVLTWLERLIEGGDVAGERDAGSPGSDGALPYPEPRGDTVASVQEERGRDS
jgi:hypothetical protein